MKKILSIILLITFALIICNMFSSCKARKVSLSKVDSNTTQNKEQKVSVITSTQDTGKVNTTSTTTQKDSASYQVNIKVGGKEVKIINGNYSGPADEITITGKHQSSVNEVKNIAEIKGLSTTSKVDSSSKENSETSVSKKLKDTATKPDYSWLIYAAIGVVIILLFLFIYFKIKK